MQCDLSDGEDVLVVGPQQIVNDDPSALVHLDTRSAGDLVAWAGRSNQAVVGRNNERSTQ